MSDSDVWPNLYIVGAQCTGKTTLVNDLKGEFRALSRLSGIEEPGFIQEVARTVITQHKFATEDIRASPDQSLALQKRILEAQVKAEQNVLHRSPWLVSDRSGLDPIVYACRYVGPSSARALQQTSQWHELSDRMSSSVIVICEAGASWLKDDGVRLMPEDRGDWIAFHQLFCALLEESGLRYTILPCNIQDRSARVQFVLRTWQQFAEE